MNILNAKEVKLIKQRDERKVVTRLFTDNQYTQEVFIDMSQNLSPDKIEVCILFDKKHPVPKVISLSAIQYTTKELPLELSLFLKGKHLPYEVRKMDDFRTIITPKRGTNRIVITCNKTSCAGKSAQIKLSVNHATF